MLLSRLRVPSGIRSLPFYRSVSSLNSNRYINVFPNTPANNQKLLTYLETDPPNPRIAIGTTTEDPPTPRSFAENPKFLALLNDVLAQHAHEDPYLQSQAQVYASPGGTSLGSGGAFFPQQRKERGAKGMGGDGAGGASAQGGVGGAGVGGYVHLNDLRNPPDFGRIPFPEDILGSVEVDGNGKIIGRFEPSGTYRIITNEGILGLTDFLRNKLIERLKEEEKKN